MSDKQKHPIHQSLVTRPTFGGIPREQFFLELAVCLVIFNIFRVSIIAIILMLGVYVCIHRLLKSAYKRDPMLAELWLMKLFDSQTYYPPQPDINAERSASQSSTPNK